jgi:hypothetical protein
MARLMQAFMVVRRQNTLGGIETRRIVETCLALLTQVLA